MSNDPKDYVYAANSDSMDELGTRDCETLPIQFPQDVRDLLPLRLAVSMTLTEWLSVDRAFFEENAVDSIEKAIGMLVKNCGEFLIYRVFSEAATPAWTCTLDWPLRRRGKLEIALVSKVPSGVDIELSNAIFEIRNRPSGLYRSCLMLKTGGRSTEEAIKRWTGLALALRPLLQV
jgi:hypothetical protein